MSAFSQKAIRTKMGKKTTAQLIDEVWTTLGEIAVSQKEFDKRFEKSREEFHEDLKKINKTLGSWSHNLGDFAEEYFQNSFEQGKTNFFGEHFDKLRKNLKGDESEDEYDIVLINGEYVGIVEVKFKGHENNIPDILKQANTFRENFPKYKGHKIYLGLASMSFYKELEERCKNEGIAIIKQVGDNVIINDKHLKAF